MNIIRNVEDIFDKYCSHQNHVYITDDIFNLKLAIVRLFTKDKGNPVPSIELFAEVLNDAMNGRADAGCSDEDIEDLYKEMKPWFDFKYIKDKDFNQDILTAIPKQNGVETNNEQPKFKLSEWCNEFKNGACKCNAHSEETLCNEVRYGS